MIFAYVDILIAVHNVVKAVNTHREKSLAQKEFS